MSTSATSRLPIELLSAVFAALVPDRKGPLASLASFWVSRQAVAGVSRYWGEVLLSTRAVWTSVWIYRFTPAAFLTFCLARGALLDLAVFIDTRDARSVVVDDQVRRLQPSDFGEFYDVLDGTLGRVFGSVRELRITMSAVGIWGEMARRLSLYDPASLRFFSLHNLGPPGHHSEELAGVFDAAVNLAQVAISAVCLRGSPTMYAGVTSLELNNIWDTAGMEWSCLRDTLQACSALSRLVLHLVECVNVNAAMVATLPLLTHFIFTSDGALSTAVVGQLHAPNVEKLSVHLLRSASVEAFTAQATHLLSHTRVLKATFLMPNGNAFPRFLATLHKTETLDMRGVGGVSGYARDSEYDVGGRPLAYILRAMNDSPHTLPRLSTLSVTRGAEEQEVADFMACVRARSPSALPILRCYAITYWETVEWSDGPSGLTSRDVDWNYRDSLAPDMDATEFY